MRKLATALFVVIACALAHCQSDQTENCLAGSPCTGSGTSCTPAGACWQCLCDNGSYNCEHAKIDCDARVNTCPPPGAVVDGAHCSFAPGCSSNYACGAGNASAGMCNCYGGQWMCTADVSCDIDGGEDADAGEAGDAADAGDAD